MINLRRRSPRNAGRGTGRSASRRREIASRALVVVLGHRFGSFFVWSLEDRGARVQRSGLAVGVDGRLGVVDLAPRVARARARSASWSAPRRSPSARGARGALVVAGELEHERLLEQRAGGRRLHGRGRRARRRAPLRGSPPAPRPGSRGRGWCRRAGSRSRRSPRARRPRAPTRAAVRPPPAAFGAPGPAAAGRGSRARVPRIAAAEQEEGDRDHRQVPGPVDRRRDQEGAGGGDRRGGKAALELARRRARETNADDDDRARAARAAERGR